jgi:hypothetical protein
MKTLTLMLAVGISAAGAYSSAQDIRATVNGTPVHFQDVQPMMINGRVMVPLRGVFEHMGATVTWFPQTRTVIAQNSTTEVRLPIGSMTAWVGGQSVPLDSPAILRNGRTMVPLRFTAEALNANVDWLAESRTVAINTMGVEARPSPPTNPPTEPLGKTIRIETDTVIPFKLDQRLTSNGARVGDRFTATLDPNNNAVEYLGLPTGTKVEGRVHTARPKEGDTPGVLGLEFQRLRLPNGAIAPVDGFLVGLDSRSVEERDGRLVAKADARKDDLTYVGYGAGAGILLSVLGKGDLLTNALIGGALGYLFGEIQKDRTKSRDVSLDAGTRFGVRLDRELVVRY